VQKRLLADFFNNSNVGLAIFDDQLCYQAVNLCLATMHGIPAESHSGKTLREILGEVALQVEPAVKQVLTTGQPILNLEIAGALPTKPERRRWVDHLFPLKDANGRVKQVGAVVVELRPDTKLEPAVEIHEAESLADTANEVLRSWKEIAKYVGACVKTVQRWEQHYNFPIRRIERRKGAVVFALKAEVDRWIRMRTQMASQP
jgi:PAS domain-containing protein